MGFLKPKAEKAVDQTVEKAVGQVPANQETTAPRGESDSYAANMGRNQARKRRRGRGTVLASAMGTQDTLG